MLRELRIQNYAIVEEASLLFEEGLHIVTGETGAGKSILVEAIAHLLGGRAGAESIRHASDEAILSARFDDPSDLSSDSIVFKRVLSQAGKGRAYLNGDPVPLSTLKAHGVSLIEIHGQEDHDRLIDPVWRLRLLDGWGGLWADRTAYANLYGVLIRLQKEEAALRLTVSGGTDDLLQFQLAELQNARLSPGEEERLLSEERFLKNRDAVLTAAGGGYAQLSDEGAILAQLEVVGQAVRQLHAMTQDAEAEIALWEAARIGLQELSVALRARLSDGRSDDPARLDDVTARIYLIQKLKKKYGGSVEAVLQAQQKIADAQATSLDGKQRMEQLFGEISQQRGQCEMAASALSKKREEKKADLEKAVQNEINLLGMEKTTFKIVLDKGPLSDDGSDRAVFMMALPGEPPRSLEHVASGGERSRIMLALKAALAVADPTPTLIFDEIDTGVGGGVAERIGRRLLHLAQRHQVFSITHLPQIAAFAQHHYVVEKSTQGERVVASVRKLSEPERVEEIARMLGGVVITPLTRRHAREMIESASK